MGARRDRVSYNTQHRSPPSLRRAPCAEQGRARSGGCVILPEEGLGESEDYPPLIQIFELTVVTAAYIGNRLSAPLTTLDSRYSFFHTPCPSLCPARSCLSSSVALAPCKSLVKQSKHSSIPVAISTQARLHDSMFRWRRRARCPDDARACLPVQSPPQQCASGRRRPW